MKPFSETHPSLYPLMEIDEELDVRDIQKHTLDKAVVRAAIEKQKATGTIEGSRHFIVAEVLLEELGLDKDGDEPVVGKIDPQVIPDLVKMGYGRASFNKDGDE